MQENITFEIPIIDFGLLKTRDEATKSNFLKAITEVGFFFLKNHDVPKELTDRLELVSRNSYKTTFEERMKLKDFRGKMEVSGSIFHEKPFQNSPDDESIKLDEKEIDSTFFDYLTKISNIGVFLLKFCEEVFDLPNGRLLGNFEPKKAIIDAVMLEENPTEEFEFECHRDNRLMTILKQDRTGGVEIKYKDNWYPVLEDPKKEFLGVNIGNIMNNLSDGKAKAVYHRVRSIQNQTRFMWPVFLTPNFRPRKTAVKFLRFTHRGWYDFDTVDDETDFLL
ncbi:Oidioi.mRNA.OKI2018_I69.chr1.g570.t1.cds [Oikopleura dioica]|uniref:Oidioi.mRNA.OKI2018_I69.chr1.g570.t1.cds n=1 Tax=Oikopleura dioica TaxID=34765 RepID=A0ABN7SPL9_OIKDI|nr:Oidioi.mRNA.OKI2018_I69.chr1.g570.t1.cds [Oikopleura dioica]